MNPSPLSTGIIRQVGRLFSHLPQFPPSAAMATALNLGPASQLDGETLARLNGRVLRIVVVDAGLRFTLRCDGRFFRPGFSSDTADVTISASVHDFGLLALRREDPDTLFFARRLRIEGDTELGLMVKNALDALDTAKLAPFLERLAPLGRRLD